MERQDFIAPSGNTGKETKPADLSGHSKVMRQSLSSGMSRASGPGFTDVR